MGWKQILDETQIGQRFPAHKHDHEIKNLSDIGTSIAGSCDQGGYTTAATCCCQGPSHCGDWNPVTEECSGVRVWNLPQPDWTGGILNANGDILGLFPSFNAADLTNKLVYLSQDQTNLDQSEWKQTNASDDTAGAKSLLGIVLEDNTTEPVRVLTTGYIAMDTTSNFVATGTALAPGQIIYMAPDSGKLTNVAPANAPNVVRVMGYIVQLESTGSSTILFHFKPDAVWIEVA